METAICPSHNETRGSFATISDGKCRPIDWMALMRRLVLVDRWKWVGYRFLLLFEVATQLVMPRRSRRDIVLAWSVRPIGQI